MARNPMRFQKGMSLTELNQKYGTEEKCETALKAWRWPDGFVCPHCGSKEHAIVGARRLYLCHGCRSQTSLKAGTIFPRTLLPLTKWFQAIWMITQAKNSISTLELSRHSAALMRHKLMSVMVERESTRKLDGRVEMDDAVLGGEKSEPDGGKRGRGGPNKVPFVAAVATDDDDHPQRLLLHVVKAHDGQSIEAMAAAHLASTARVVPDGLGCFRAVTKAGCTHEPIIAGRAPEQPRRSLRSAGANRARQPQDCDRRHGSRWRSATPSAISRSSNTASTAAPISASAARFVAGLLAATLLQRRVCLPAHVQASYLEEIGCQRGMLFGEAELIVDDRYDAPGLRPRFANVSHDSNLIFFTSGSTGTPKAVPKTLSQLEIEARALEAQWGASAGKVLATVSHQHIYGMLFRIVWPILSGRCSADRAAAYWEQLEGKLGPETTLVSSPAHLTRLPASLGAASPQLVFSSGQALAFTAVEACIRHFGTTPIEVLGSTETGGIAWRKQDFEGTPWTPFADVEVEADKDGLLHVRSPYLPGQNALATGDGVVMADGGRFHLRPRGDRVEKVEGRRVSLTRVEEALRALPDVTAATVCTLPAFKAALGAVVVLSREGRTRLAGRGAFRLSRDLRRALATRLEPSERPKHWRFVAEIPVDERGKHNQAMLRALFFSPLHGLELDISSQGHDTAEIKLKLTREVIYFAGHFPDRAILPGVAQVHLAALIAYRIWQFRPGKADLARVKFSRVLVPDNEIVMLLERDDLKERLRFTLRVGDVTASQGEIG